ncbi:MAG: zf-HC2 domain-containing protein [Verrucomicrobia bacterium]|nr:zf-HC2 domain-containing protein [Verrucomicrobiota bacterium]
MNCRTAQRLLSAERDGALAAPERAGLAAHVAGCAECRQFQAALGEAGNRLRSAAARVPVPDEERAWQDIHREIRAARPEATRAWWGPVKWALPLGAAATLAVILAWAPSDDDLVSQSVARAEFVEVPGDASSVVYVDDKSGWLVVWASAPAAKGG